MSTLSLRRVHKWIGLILGIQFLIWTVSGAAMALLDMDEVAGGPRAAASAPTPLPLRSTAWPQVQAALGTAEIRSLVLRPLLDRNVVEVRTDAGVQLFDAESGAPVAVDAALARRVADAAHPGVAPITRVADLERLTLAVREHRLPIWRVDFSDDENSSYYVSGATGKLLERRNDSWRAWDVFWMLHTMDYANRTSFNHPLIIAVGFGIVWLAITGLWLLFRTVWRPDLRALRRASGRA
jgi:uncharacterized iron-regulated membrane protein